MTERSFSEVTPDSDDVSCEIKRARIGSLSSDKSLIPMDSSKGYSNGNTEENNACCGTSEERRVNGASNGLTSPPSSPPPSPTTLPIVNPVLWVQKQIANGVNPVSVLVNILPPNVALPEGLSDLTLWRIVVEILSDMPKRCKLPHINTLHDVVSLLRSCRNIIVVSGAGISVSCGIPDFRSKDGIYARLAVDFPDLPNPQAMFDIQYFSHNPKPFYKFASEIWPGQFEPSPSHHFIKQLEDRGSLLRNYTQNIDTLEVVCGIRNIIQCHGSFSTATCRACGHQVDSDAIKEDVMHQVIPACQRCTDPSPQSIMKPDIVFFGEGLPSEFHQAIETDRIQADLIIVMGSSLKVKPVAHIPNLVPPDIPQILINREPLPHLNFDVELLGDCDVVVRELCRQLDWNHPAADQRNTSVPPSAAEEQYTSVPPSEERYTCVPPARYLFSGAEIPEDEVSQGDSASDSEEQSVVTTEDEDTTSENYVTQMRYAMGCHSRTYSENPGPSRISEEREECWEEREGCWEGETPAGPWGERGPPAHLESAWDSAGSSASMAAQMGDSRQPSLDNASVCSDLGDQEIIMMLGEQASTVEEEDALLATSSIHPKTLTSSDVASENMTSSIEENAGNSSQEAVVVDSMS